MANDTAVVTQNLPPLTFAAGLAGLGILSVISHDFGFQWQPVAQSFPDRQYFAVAVGILEMAAALALPIPASRKAAAAVVAALYGFWALLHSPTAIEKPLNVSAWLGVAEPFSIFAASLALALPGEDKHLREIAIRAFGIACIVFGASHFAYGAFTAEMVPAWLPQRLPLAYATGAIHTACGIAILLHFRTAIFAAIEAAMMTSFVGLVHIPRVAAAPDNRFEWTMLLVAVILSSSAAIVSGQSLRSKQAD
jgi:uncharacterized membrane protein